MRHMLAHCTQVIASHHTHINDFFFLFHSVPSECKMKTDGERKREKERVRMLCRKVNEVKVIKRKQKNWCHQ